MHTSRPLKMQSGNRRCVVVDAEEKAVTRSRKKGALKLRFVSASVRELVILFFENLFDRTSGQTFQNLQMFAATAEASRNDCQPLGFT